MDTPNIADRYKNNFPYNGEEIEKKPVAKVVKMSSKIMIIFRVAQVPNSIKNQISRKHQINPSKIEIFSGEITLFIFLQKIDSPRKMVKRTIVIIVMEIIVNGSRK